MDELQEHALKDDWMYGRCERTGLCGGFPYDSIYILPTCEKPPPEFMVRPHFYVIFYVRPSVCLVHLPRKPINRGVYPTPNKQGKPQPTSILVYSEREKNSFDSNYYMDIFILNFV